MPIRSNANRRTLQHEQLETRYLLAASLVADINQTGIRADRIDGFEYVELDDAVYYNIGVNARRQLWKLERNSIVPEFVFEIRSRGDTSLLTTTNGSIFMRGTVSESVVLWASDGTPGGTRIVEEELPGMDLMTDGTDAVYLATAGTGIRGQEIRRSDGTGTELLLKLDTLRNQAIQDLTVLDDTIFFTIYDAIHGRELWSIDANDPAATVLDVRSGRASSSPRDLTKLGDVLFFTASHSTYGRELWRSDGTSEGTFVVKDINPEPTSPGPESLVTLHDTLYFSAEDGVHGRELWRSNGTAETTGLVADILVDGSSDPTSLTVSGEQIFFLAQTPSGGQGLWVTDGTSAGTNLVHDPALPAAGLALGNLTAARDGVFFTLTTADHAALLFNDGSSDGTHEVFDFSDVPDAQPQFLFGAEDRLLFVSRQGTGGLQLWQSDGTENGTFPIQRFAPRRNTGSEPRSLTLVGDTLFYFANDGIHGRELWKTNAQNGAHELVREIVPGDSDWQSGEQLIAVGDRLFFVVGKQLWRSDSTPAGTTPFADFSAGTYAIQHLIDVDGTLFFAADDGVHGRELWMSDGTSEGTMMVQDIYEGRLASKPAELANIDGMLYFSADHPVHGRELWKTDGVSTNFVADVGKGLYGSEPHSFTHVDGTTYFLARTPFGLWQTDGTSAGTRLVERIDYAQAILGSLNGAMFFLAGPQPRVDLELRVVRPGETASTVLASHIDIGNVDNLYPVVFAGKLFFNAYASADDGSRRSNIWSTDGTPSGTKPMISDRQITMGTKPTLTADAFYFNTGDAVWRSDGTDEGTFPIDEALLVNTDSLAAYDGNVFFAADDGVLGTELWISASSAVAFSGEQLILNEINGTADAVVTLVRSGSTANAASASVAVLCGIGKGAQVGEVLRDPIHVDFPASATAQQITIPFGGNDLPEPNAIYWLEITDATGTSVGVNSTFQITIIDDDRQLGDFNADGAFRANDVDALVRAIVVGDSNPSYDLNDDGVLDENDLDAWLTAAGAANLPAGAPYLRGDANLDGFVDRADFEMWHRNRFRTLPAFSAGDFNADGGIDGSDFGHWNQNKTNSGQTVVGPRVLRGVNERRGDKEMMVFHRSNELHNLVVRDDNEPAVARQLDELTVDVVFSTSAGFEAAFHTPQDFLVQPSAPLRSDRFLYL